VEALPCKREEYLEQAKIAIAKQLLHSYASQILCDDIFVKILKLTSAYSCHISNQEAVIIIESVANNI